MYQVKFKKTGKWIEGGELFFTYERARQAARRHARDMVRSKKVKKTINNFGFWDGVSKGPSMLSKLYAIVRVD